jgi:hypothetical protein
MIKAARYLQQSKDTKMVTIHMKVVLSTFHFGIQRKVRFPLRVKQQSEIWPIRCPMLAIVR